MSAPTPTYVAPVSLTQAREHQRRAQFIEEWVRRVLRTFRVDACHRDDLRAAGRVGGARGMKDWEALPEPERTPERLRTFVARGIVDEASLFLRQTYGRAQGERARALSASVFHADDNESLEARFQGICAHLNHETYAGLLHDSLGLESPEDLYLEREQQELDKNKVKYALARLEERDERVFAHELLIEDKPLKEAAAAVGIHERSKRLRERDKLFKKLRQHVVVFASSVAARREPDRGDREPR